MLRMDADEETEDRTHSLACQAAARSATSTRQTNERSEPRWYEILENSTEIFGKKVEMSTEIFGKIPSSWYYSRVWFN